MREVCKQEVANRLREIGLGEEDKEYVKKLKGAVEEWRGQSAKNLEGVRMMTVQRDTWKARSDGYSKEHDRLVMELAGERWKVIKLQEELDFVYEENSIARSDRWKPKISPVIAPGCPQTNLSSQAVPPQQAARMICPGGGVGANEKTYLEWLQQQQGENAATHQKWIHPDMQVNPQIVQPGDGELK